MKGLLLKDWYSSWKENKVVFVRVSQGEAGQGRA